MERHQKEILRLLRVESGSKANEHELIKLFDQMPTSMCIDIFRNMESEAHRNRDKYKAAMDSIVQVSTSLFEHKDPYTAEHERRVAELACLIGLDMSLDEDAI